MRSRIPLLDRAGDGPADRSPFEHLEVGDLVGADDPVAAAGQPLGVPVAPEDLLGAGLEPGIKPGRSPVARTVRLQVHAVEDTPHGPSADRLDDALDDSLPGQILARPTSDVQARGDRFQTGQFDDPGALEGGKSGSVDPVVGAPRGARAPRCLCSAGRCARPCRRRTPGGTRPPRSGAPRRSPGPSGRGGPDTTVRSRSERPLVGWHGREYRSKAKQVFVHAWGNPVGRNRLRSTAKRVPRIPCATSGQGH